MVTQHPAVVDSKGRLLDVVQCHWTFTATGFNFATCGGFRAQPLELDVTLFLDNRKAPSSLSSMVARLEGELRFLSASCTFLDAGEAAEAVCAYILAPPTEDSPHAQVQATTVRLQILSSSGNESIAGLRLVQVHRTAEEMSYQAEHKPSFNVDILHETDGCGIYRLRVKPGGSIPSHKHLVMEEHEMVMGSGLLLQGKPVARGQAFTWPKGFVHQYDNPSQTEQTVLCVDRPRFIPSDEVQAEVPSEGLQHLEGSCYYAPEAQV